MNMDSERKRISACFSVTASRWAELQFSSFVLKNNLKSFVCKIAIPPVCET
jgi:hypothetical protein